MLNVSRLVFLHVTLWHYKIALSTFGPMEPKHSGNLLVALVQSAATLELVHFLLRLYMQGLVLGMLINVTAILLENKRFSLLFRDGTKNYSLLTV